MNTFILNKEVQTYLRENQFKDFREISLKKSIFEGIEASELAQQIKGLQIAKTKFPFFYEKEGIVYPPSLNLEQSSSWATAVYKSKLLEGKTLIDLTAGMGIDAFAFAQNFEKVTALERNPDLVEICKHNYSLLNQTNLEYHSTQFENYFEENPNQNWDVIYLDPARRKNAQKKFLLEDLEPNILEWMPKFLKHAAKVMVKLSPLMDLKKIIDQIPQTQEIHLVAVKNEVKELLIICENQLTTNPKIVATNLVSKQTAFSFHFEDEKETIVHFSSAETYLYEPNSAIIKSGGFKKISKEFQLNKLETSTHLYTSNHLNIDFPGKIYEVLEEMKDLKKSIQNQKFHVISKNYPLSVELIRKKYKLKEGEERTLIFTKSINGLQHLLCKRVN